MALVQKELKNAYIGEYKEWQPGANTIAYYKFDGNLNDSSGNNRNLSIASGSFTYGTESGGGKYVYMPKNSYTNNYTSMRYDSSSYNISLWAKRVANVTVGGVVADFHTGGNYFPRMQFQTSFMQVVVGRTLPFPSGFDTGQWHYYCLSISNNSATCYIDGAYYWTGALNSYNNNLPYFRLNTAGYAGSYVGESRDGRLSELIIESVPRTAQEVSDYYEQTKSLYGIS